MSVEKYQLPEEVRALIADAATTVSDIATQEADAKRRKAEEKAAQEQVDKALGKVTEALDDYGKVHDSGRFRGITRYYDEEVRSRHVTVDGQEFQLRGTLTKLRGKNWVKRASATLYGVFPHPTKKDVTISRPLFTILGNITFISEGKNGELRLPLGSATNAESRTKLSTAMQKVAVEVMKHPRLI